MREKIFSLASQLQWLSIFYLSVTLKGLPWNSIALLHIIIQNVSSIKEQDHVILELLIAQDQTWIKPIWIFQKGQNHSDAGTILFPVLRDQRRDGWWATGQEREWIMSEYVSGHAAKVMKAEGKWRIRLCDPLFICDPTQDFQEMSQQCLIGQWTASTT